jgi:hypothetical protein
MSIYPELLGNIFPSNSGPVLMTVGYPHFRLLPVMTNRPDGRRKGDKSSRPRCKKKERT